MGNITAGHELISRTAKKNVFGLLNILTLDIIKDLGVSGDAGLPGFGWL